MAAISFGVILPHTLLYGGVKRFFELGKALTLRGHQFTVFTPDSHPPEWFGQTGVSLRSPAELSGFPLDVLFFTEKRYLEPVLGSMAKHKVFYQVREGDRVWSVVRHRDISTFACSTNIFRHDRFWYGKTPFLAIGGVDTELYSPATPGPGQDGVFTILAYGRLAERRKGTMYVVRACERLYERNRNIKLLLFDTPVNEKMKDAIKNFTSAVPFEFILNHPVRKNPELYARADVFVSAERGAGWTNTVAEAMASGLPVIATRSGTLDMIIDDETGIFVRRNTRSICRALQRLIDSPGDRKRLSANGRKHIEQYDWANLADRIVDWYISREAGEPR